MRKLLFSLALSALVLGGCAQFQQFYDTVKQDVGIVFNAKVSPKAVYIARQAFNAAEVTATSWIKTCTGRPSTPGCSLDTLNLIADAVRSGRQARKELRSYSAAHPDAIGAQGAYDALVAATRTIRGAFVRFGIQ